MDGSQLPTEWTHLNLKLVPGVSDSKMRDVSQKKESIRAQEGQMAKNVESIDIGKKSKTSKKVTMTKSPENSTNR